MPKSIEIRLNIFWIKRLVKKKNVAFRLEDMLKDVGESLKHQ